MSMFNFQAEDNSRVFSPWIWLYFVSSAVLSGFIVAVWRMSSRRKMYAIEKEYGEEAVNRLSKDILAKAEKAI
jgi:hypothetical protein